MFYWNTKSSDEQNTEYLILKSIDNERGTKWF